MKPGTVNETTTDRLAGGISIQGSINPFDAVLAESLPEIQRKNIRVVGSAYLPDADERIDFKAPRPTDPLFTQYPGTAKRYTFGMILETVASDILKRIRD
ncbi:hypothetical protein [Phyllobacterium myrsinacearum]|uniref:Uncharacterized protein n=1 Tax=Phyllobacterium myrsinacearum TaxID=28101 RepID=A0A839EL32_9HYPH|nr:hypothetical protein [Phyllobacterium myrsinacearum]MBA8878998.1 hypothetical protein [Phyllobacterium myrsinacearum]